MSTSRLALYNAALRLIGESRLSTLSDNIESRYVMDDIYDQGGIKHCLEQGYWNFAIRTGELSYDAGVSPSFGYQRAFQQPTDMVRLVEISADDYFNVPLLEYVDEDAYWFCDYDNIYVRYISDDNAYGNDLSLWPETFKRYVECHFAVEGCEALTQNESKFETLLKLERRRLRDAKAKDAMNQPTAFPPSGSWVNSRGSSLPYDYPRGKLIG